MREPALTPGLSDLNTSVVEVIEATRDGRPLGPEVVWALVRAFTTGEVTDAQMAAWAMAVCCRSLDDIDSVALAQAMADSGDRADWRPLEHVVDKHSTGGVGDKLSFVVAPLLAAAGAHVPMLSGRGLGHTGGTLDKLESIGGLRVDIPSDDKWRILQDVGCFIAAASDDLAPADRKLYALRDVTGTVASVPLIAASIMSKKLAAGVDSLVLDVKFGTGAFMQDIESARTLARAMVDIANRGGVCASAQLCAMNAPTGLTAGNALEIQEALEVLSGRGPRDVRLLSLALTREAADLCKLSVSDAELETLLDKGAALEKFVAMVEAQGGDLDALATPSVVAQVTADRSGIVGFDALGVGRAAWRIGAGRTLPGQVVDPCAGVRLVATPGHSVRTGDTVALLYATKDAFTPATLEAARRELTRAVCIADDPQGLPLPACSPHEWIR